MNIEKIKKQVDAWHIEIIADIRTYVDVHLHGSGIVRGGGREGNLQLCTYPDTIDEDGDSHITYHSIVEGDVDMFTIVGFTEDGVINDAYMGICTTDYENIPFEELLWIHKLVKETHSQLQ